MSRIVYFAFSNGAIQGGHKMILRHVEALRGLGFDAVVYIGAQNKMPDWFQHKLPVEVGTPVRPDDILVLPDDGSVSLRQAADIMQRSVVISQNPYMFAARSFEALDSFPASRFPPFIAAGPMLAATIRRLYPQAKVDVVPCFADERLFRPAATRRPAVAFAPRKRPMEALVIRNFFGKLHPGRTDLEWLELMNVSEADMARAFGEATLHLSLSRLESVGMTTLEAMAGGCVCAGFTGVGGWDYATPENGFWVADDDCEAAADALAQADDLVRTGGPALARHLEAGFATARHWSYAAFRLALEEAWMKLAPDARLRNGPLD
jgi:glycosyltransferase involved in cell wall biosynthesis